TMSDDGRFVVFVSAAPNLVPGQVDTNGVNDVFLYDRVLGTAALVSHTATPNVAGNGTSDVAVLSPDPNSVALESGPSNLGSGITDGNGSTDVYLYERATAAITLVSHASSATTAGNGISARPRISAVGSVVAFHSGSTDLGGGYTDPNGNQRDV